MFDWLDNLWEDSWLQDIFDSKGLSEAAITLGSTLLDQGKTDRANQLGYDQAIDVAKIQAQNKLDAIALEGQLRKELGFGPQPPYMAMQAEENKRTKYKGLLEALQGAARGRIDSANTTNAAIQNILGALNN